MSGLLHDATQECERCGLPMMPVSEEGGVVTLECANRHRQTAPIPSDEVARERMRSWIRRRGAQLHVQHERWEQEAENAAVGPRVIRPSERRTQTGQTAGMRREEAVQTDGAWAGFVRTEPGRLSSWHHHGAHESIIFVLRGTVRVECGPGGTTVLDARPGDYIYLPPREIHREGNDGDVESEIVVFRAGTGELVFNVQGPAD